ncbi:MAG: PDZ domain-containing protein, partial [Exilispira sp.]
TKPGEKVTLQILRKEDGKIKNLTITLVVEKRQSKSSNLDKPNNWLGVLVGEMDQSTKEKYKSYGVKNGVIVLAVQKNSVAAQLGIIEKDVIYQINEYEITDPEQFYQILEKTKNSKKVIILINRRGMSLMLTIGR